MQEEQTPWEPCSYLLLLWEIRSASRLDGSQPLLSSVEDLSTGAGGSELGGSQRLVSALRAGVDVQVSTLATCMSSCSRIWRATEPCRWRCLLPYTLNCSWSPWVYWLAALFSCPCISIHTYNMTWCPVAEPGVHKCLTDSVWRLTSPLSGVPGIPWPLCCTKCFHTGKAMSLRPSLT